MKMLLKMLWEDLFNVLTAWAQALAHNMVYCRDSDLRAAIYAKLQIINQKIDNGLPHKVILGPNSIFFEIEKYDKDEPPITLICTLFSDGLYHLSFSQSSRQITGYMDTLCLSQFNKLHNKLRAQNGLQKV